MRTHELFEARVDPVEAKKQALAKLLKDASPERVVDGLARVLSPSQIDRLIDLFGLGASKDNIEFVFKMLLKALPPELNVSMDEIVVSRGRVVNGLIGKMDMFKGTAKTQEEVDLVRKGFIWFSLTYYDGKWRVEYEAWDLQENKHEYVKENGIEPSAFLAFMKKQVPAQIELFRQAKQELEARKNARRKKRNENR